MPYATVNGIKIWYEAHGSGEPLLMMNPTGWPGSIWNLEQVGPLSQHYKVITYDPRGVGRSDKPDHDYTTALFAEDALGLLSAIDAVPAHVFGFSLGGRIAQIMAIKEPKAFRSLVLAASDAGGGSAKGGIPFRVAAALVEHPYNMDFWLDHLLAEHPFSPQFRAQHPEKIRRLAETIAENQPPPKLYLRHIMARGKHNMTGNLGDIRVPTLVMVGEKDCALSTGSNHVQSARNLAAKIPDAELVIVDAYHLFPWEIPEETNRLLLEFLGRHASVR
jgi:pimeloyl-ACP methyl ester carboxylesterase